MNRTILKLIAVISMFIDHLAVALSLSGILGRDYRLLYRIMRDVGRMAFPIYGLMLVEGVLHTSNKWKYLLRMVVFALISELPFDLALRGKMFVWNHQNVYFTLTLGLLIMFMIHWASRLPGWKKLPGLALTGAFALGCAYLSGKVLHFDYGISGIVMLTVLGVLTMPLTEIRSWIPWENLVRCFFVAAAVILMTPFTSNTEYFALFALIPIAFYNGVNGRISGTAVKYAFYVFYPLHLLLLWLCFVLPAFGVQM